MYGPPPPFDIHFDDCELNLIHMATTWKILHMSNGVCCRKTFCTTQKVPRKWTRKSSLNTVASNDVCTQLFHLKRNKCRNIFVHCAISRLVSLLPFRWNFVFLSFSLWNSVTFDSLFLYWRCLRDLQLIPSRFGFLTKNKKKMENQTFNDDVRYEIRLCKFTFIYSVAIAF
jgi:hypothetical protein